MGAAAVAGAAVFVASAGARPMLSGAMWCAPGQPKPKNVEHRRAACFISLVKEANQQETKNNDQNNNWCLSVATLSILTVSCFQSIRLVLFCEWYDVRILRAGIVARTVRSLRPQKDDKY